VEAAPDLPQQLDAVLSDLGGTLRPEALELFDPERQSAPQARDLPRRQQALFGALVDRRFLPRA